MTESFFGEDTSAKTQPSLHSRSPARCRFQTEAIRLFSTFVEAYHRFNDADGLITHLGPLEHRSLNEYRNRRPWNVIEVIPQERLPDLGYISAARARQEADERRLLADFLIELAEKVQANASPRCVRSPPSWAF